MTRPPAPIPARRRPAMTLVELVVSLALVTLIVAACGSMLAVAAKAMGNDKSNVGTDATVAREAADQVVDDLKMATAVTEQSATAVTVTVPDRDGDGVAETIRYAWSGVAGDPLTRAYNARPAAAVAANVRALNFGYLGKTVGKPPAVEGAEQSVAVHASGVTANLVGHQLTGVKGASGYVKPDFSAAVTATGGPTTWKPTRCRVQLQRDGISVGTVTVTVKYADGAKKPTGAALCSGTALIASVQNSPTWVDVGFTSTGDVDCTKGVCVVVTYAMVTGIGGYVFADTVSADASMSFCTTVDSGASWTTPAATSALQLYLWGKVTTQDNDTYDFQPLPQAAP